MTSVELVLRQIDQAFDHKSWHGTNLKGSLRGLTASEAAWRPAKGLHNIWELVLHAAYWKYTVRRRLLGIAPGAFPLDGSNFFERPKSPKFSEVDWKSDLAILIEQHRDLRSCVAALSPKELETGSAGKMRILDLAIGIAAHDLYHAGQIQALKRQQR